MGYSLIRWEEHKIENRDAFEMSSQVCNKTFQITKIQRHFKLLWVSTTQFIRFRWHHQPHAHDLQIKLQTAGWRGQRFQLHSISFWNKIMVIQNFTFRIMRHSMIRFIFGLSQHKLAIIFFELWDYFGGKHMHMIRSVWCHIGNFEEPMKTLSYLNWKNEWINERMSIQLICYRLSCELSVS